MLIFSGIVGVFSVVIAWLVTGRLFALARRTRCEPERLLAFGFGGLFCVGYPLAGASRGPGLALTTEGSLLYAIGAIGIALGIAAFARFPYRVYRRGSRWAAVTSGLIGLVGAIASLGSTVIVASAFTTKELVSRMQPWALLLMAAILSAFLWNACESFLYHRNMKRRLALGLADPETTHLFLLWGLASGCAVLSMLAIVFIRASGTAMLTPFPMAIMACSSLISSACWWLAFFMPESYRARLLRTSPPQIVKSD